MAIEELIARNERKATAREILRRFGLHRHPMTSHQALGAIEFAMSAKKVADVDKHLASLRARQSTEEKER